MLAATRVPRPGLETTTSVPPTAASRSRMLVNPRPPVIDVESKPAPSSRTSTRSAPLSDSSITEAVAPCACLAAFCSASRQQKYAAVSTSR
jgi:hypothetical protein